MAQRRSPIRLVASFLRGLWRTRMGKVSAAFVLLGLWRPGFLLVPLAYYAVKLVRAGMRRLLYSVRARLAAFYVYAALLPVLLGVTVLVFVLYVVLGQVSARVIESRLERQVEWAEQRQHRVENAYWRNRAGGSEPRPAMQAALQEAFADVTAPDFAYWALDLRGAEVAVRGSVPPAERHAPAWLGERRFVGIAMRDTSEFQLRTRLRLVDGDAVFEVGSMLPIGMALLNSGLPGTIDEVRAGLGSPERSLRECEALDDSALVEQGVVGSLGGGAAITVSPTQVRVEGQPAGTVGTHAPNAMPRLRSRFGLQHWAYLGYPLDWATGRTDAPGPTVVTTFSVEGAARELLRTGLGVTPVIKFLVGIVVGALLLLQIGGTVRGLLYARTISNAVAKLDRGVRAIEAGDFDHRIAARERDQLGALARAFDHMSERLQSLLEERAARQAMERELAIARDVQARLFPEQTPYAPFLSAFGVCQPARTVSGDYYDFIESSGSYDAVIADVSGKGMSAALLMASLHSALRSLYLRYDSDATPDAGDILTRLNQHLHQYVEPSRFVTLFLARYRGDGRLVYCNAGHNPAALVQGERVEWLSAGGLMLGPFPGLLYESTTVPVQPGDLLCLYTDGVTEALGQGGEQFGEERLAQALRDAVTLPPRDVATTVQQRVRDWCGDTEPSDDLTLVVLRITA